MFDKMEALYDAATALHPFYPLGLELPGFLVNEMSVPTMLVTFFGSWFVILGTLYVVVNSYNPRLSGADKGAFLWFVLTGGIHLFFEGYFSLNNKIMAPSQTYFGQLWKEYALSDSRYLTSDAFVLCMETVTAFLWGPLSFVTAWMILKQHPLRHAIQSLVSIGQIYGLILYYATSMFDHYVKDVTYCRPERYYFWAYYFTSNFIWMVIPGIMLYTSFDAIAEAFRIVDKTRRSSNRNGSIKKSS